MVEPLIVQPDNLRNLAMAVDGAQTEIGTD